MAATIRLKRGLQANLPSDLLIAEPAFTTDTNRLYIGTSAGNIEVGNRDVGHTVTTVRNTSAYWSEINTPIQSDFKKLRSFRHSFIGGGTDITDETNQLQRWQYIANNPDSSLTFSLRAAYVKNRYIPINSLPEQLRSINVNQSNLQADVWDLPGGGTTFVPTNYITFLNNLCQHLNLASRFGSTIDNNLTQKVAVSGNICLYDNFYFAFEETSNNVSFDYEVPIVGGGTDLVTYKPRYFYSISTAAPNTLFESRSFITLELLAGPGIGSTVGTGIGYWRVQP